MKKTGKALSLVLSLALVVSSLTTAFASAANVTAQGTGSVSATLSKESYLVSYKSGDTTASTVAVPTAAIGSVVYTDASGFQYSNLSTVAFSDSDWAVSGTGAKISGGEIVATGEGTTTFTATKSVSVAKRMDTTVTATVPATFKFTVRTLDVSKSYLVDATAKTLLSSINVNDALTIGVYQPGATTNSADLSSDLSGTTVVAGYTFASSNTKVRTIASDTGVTTIPSVPIAGSTQITATKTNAPTAKDVLVVNSSYNATAATTVQAAFNSSAATIVDGSTTYNVTNYTINGSGAVTLKSGTVAKIATSGAVEVDGGSVAVIDNQATSVVVNDGTIGTIYSNTAANTITVNGGAVTTITATKAAYAGSTQAAPGLVTVTKGTVKTINSQGNVTVTGGTVSGIAGVDVIVNGAVAGVPAVVAGNISASGNATIGSSAQLATTTVSGTVACSGTTLTISENNGSSPAVETTVGNVVGATANATGAYTTELVFSGFNGTIPTAPQFASVQATSNSNAVINGKLTVATVSIDTGSTLTVPDAYVGTLTGPGTLAIPAGKLVAATISGSPALSLTTSAQVGDLAYKSASGMESAFNAPGFTFTSQPMGNNVYGYYVKTVDLVGLKMSASTLKVAKGYSKTLSVTTDPMSATLPAGATIKWEAPDGAYVTVNGNGTSATVTANDWSDIDLGGVNEVTVTATIVDKDGNPLYAYNPASCVVTAVEKPDAAVTIDSVPSTMKQGQSYTVKVTATDGSVPKIAFADNFAVVTSTATSGNSQLVTFTAKTVGEHGVYVSSPTVAGSKVAVINVAGSICDTTTVSKKAGQPYTFKVTSPKAPSFVVAGIGSIKPSKVIGNDYYFTVKATANKGVHGVYVNGAAIALYTFA